MTEASALILVVDDNEMNRDMLSRRLRRQKYTVEMAENGSQALTMLREKAYDLVLLDIMMPQMNGYEVLERLKADETLRAIPVIMISAVDDLDSVVKCIEMGAEDYLFKPFNPVLLKARVGASLDKKRYRDRSLESGNHLSEVRAHLTAVQSDVEALLQGTIGAVDETAQARLQHVQETLQQVHKLLS